MAPSLIPATKTFTLDGGFPLLQFQPKHEFKPLSFHSGRIPAVPLRPLPREAWGSSDSFQPPLAQKTPHTTLIPDLNMNHNTRIIEKSDGQKKWAESVPMEVPKHVNMDQYVGHEDSKLRQDSTLLTQPEKLFNINPMPLGIPSQNSFGLPLLHLQLKTPYLYSSASSTSIKLPSVPLRTVVEERNYPRLALLHSCLSPENTVMDFTWQCKT